MQEVSFVEEEDGMEVVLGELLDMGRDEKRQTGRRRMRWDSQGQTELAVEVAASAGGVVTGGETEGGAGSSETVTECAQKPGLADAGLTG
jgi:hypothetical protein